MKVLGRLLLTLATGATLAAIWSPVGAWWQFLATAVLLLFAAVLFLSQADEKSLAKNPDPAPARSGSYGRNLNQ